MFDGWIKLHRSTAGNWVCDDPEFFRAWVLLLWSVNYRETRKTFNGEFVQLDAGQMVTSYEHLATTLRLTPAKLRRFLTLLEKDAMIAIEKTRKGTRLTVCNYKTYQESQHTEHTQNAHRTHTNNTTIRKKERKNTTTNVVVGDATNVVPTLQDCQQYAESIHMRSDEVVKFYDYFTANGWKVGGKTRMKDYKAALRNWNAKAPPPGYLVASYFEEKAKQANEDPAFASIAAKQFFTYYEARGWKTATNQRITNWRFKADEWITKNRGKQ